jgi:hypothetical protein
MTLDETHREAGTEHSGVNEFYNPRFDGCRLFAGYFRGCDR